MNIQETIWELAPHTIGKHRVLERYMQAWLPIMARSNERVLFVDAFAGPGEYKGGEPGSPVIALQTFKQHSAFDQLNGRVMFKFIEKEKDRINHLAGVLEQQGFLPSDYIDLYPSTFDQTLGNVLDQIDQHNAILAPSFMMIDPFGFSDTPMELIGRILRNRKAEVYISFMYRDINRFLGAPNRDSAGDLLFGCPDWRKGTDLSDAERKNFLHDLYRDQLKKNGATYVLHFELYENREHIYSIFFGTNDLKGCDEMKKAIWDVMPLGNFRFRGATIGQGVFEGGLIDNSELQSALREEFSGDEWTHIESIENFVMSDRTSFHKGQVRQRALIPMEERGELEVKEGTRSRARTYPPDTTELRFRDPPPKLQPGLL